MLYNSAILFPFSLSFGMAIKYAFSGETSNILANNAIRGCSDTASSVEVTKSITIVLWGTSMFPLWAMMSKEWLAPDLPLRKAGLLTVNPSLLSNSRMGATRNQLREDSFLALSVSV